MKGHTLLELVLGLGLLILLMVTMFAIFRMGASAWKKGEAHADLMHALQVTLAHCTRSVEQSVYDGLALDPPGAPTGLSLISSWDQANSEFDFDGTAGAPVWHRHVIIYYDAAQQEVLQRELAIPPTTTAAPLATLSLERTGGRVLAREITAFNCTLVGRELTFNVEATKKRYGSYQPEVLRLSSSIGFRN
ncbi:MAG: hypothetical protein KC910_33835 [Candidatus Eremiobacteraeota bacterium]|nr:hypothetical protein [Candidatus Eremiobacteraeota bacterium]